MREPALPIVAFGASTPVGRDAWSSAAAVRAGISGFAEHPYMIDTAGEPMRGAFAPWLDIDLPLQQRFEALLFPAIEQALAPLAATEPGALKLALALGLPEPRPGLPTALETELRLSLGQRYGRIFGSAATFPNGHAAGLLALQAAARVLDRGAVDACVVAGVDSYTDPETLEWLEECDQLHSAGPLNNAWGFIPGEAAGAVLLTSEELARQIGQPPLALLLGIGHGTETKRIKTETVCVGEGLTTAFRQALDHLPNGDQVSDVYCDLNGEPYRVDEYGFTCLRTKEHFVSASDFIAPADCWGDVAAAGAPLHLMLAAIAGLKGYANGPRAFVWSSSEGGDRAAAALATAEVQ